MIIRAIQSIGGIKYYWLKKLETNRKLPKRFMRTELFALKTTFLNVNLIFWLMNGF